MDEPNAQEVADLFEAPKEVVDANPIAKAPKTLTATRKIDGKTWVAGEGPKPARVMFIALSAQEEEVADTQKTNYIGNVVRQKPRYLKGAAGAIFKDICGLAGIDIRECYYTALIKYLRKPGKLKKDEIETSRPLLWAEIAEVKPDVIVCLGKPVFDLFVDTKFKMADIKGAIFYNKEFDCRVIGMDEVWKPVTKPDYVEKYRIELGEVKRLLNLQDGVVTKAPVYNRVVSTAEELKALLSLWEFLDVKVFAIDTEFGGNFIDGRLRSFQLTWAPGHNASN